MAGEPRISAASPRKRIWKRGLKDAQDPVLGEGFWQADKLKGDVLGEATGQPYRARGESEDRGGSAGFGSHLGVRGQSAARPVLVAGGGRGLLGRQQRRAASRPGSSGCDRRQGGLKLRRPDLSLWFWTHSLGRVRKPTRGVAGAIFRLGQGRARGPRPSLSCPGTSPAC